MRRVLGSPYASSTPSPLYASSILQAGERAVGHCRLADVIQHKLAEGCMLWTTLLLLCAQVLKGAGAYAKCVMLACQAGSRQGHRYAITMTSHSRVV
jgi:hypothetical protein